MGNNVAQKDFSSKFDQIGNFVQNLSHLLYKSLKKNSIFVNCEGLVTPLKATYRSSEMVGFYFLNIFDNISWKFRNITYIVNTPWVYTASSRNACAQWRRDAVWKKTITKTSSRRGGLSCRSWEHFAVFWTKLDVSFMRVVIWNT